MSTPTGPELVWHGTNGVPGGTYFVLTATNVTLLLPNWTWWTTNDFDSRGNFSFTNNVDRLSGCRFFLLTMH